MAQSFVEFVGSYRITQPFRAAIIADGFAGVLQGSGFVENTQCIIVCSCNAVAVFFKVGCFCIKSKYFEQERELISYILIEYEGERIVLFGTAYFIDDVEGQGLKAMFISPGSSTKVADLSPNVACAM